MKRQTLSDDGNDKFIPALSFNFLTPLYDPVAAITTREKTFKRELVRQIDLQPHESVLDLACGTATLTIALKQSCLRANVLGLDGDPKILGLARRKIEKAGVEIDLDVGLSDRMPYTGERFDQVISSLFFHHLTPDNKRKTLVEIWRVLKPNGFLHIADWGMPANRLMKIASLPLIWFDGATTKDSFEGKLPELIVEAGFTKVVETNRFDTIFGTIRLHRAQKA